MSAVGRTLSMRPLLADALFAVLVAAGQTLSVAYVAYGQHGVHPLDAAGQTLLILNGLALVGRRRWPVATFAVCLALSGAYHVLMFPDGPADLGTVVALYTVASVAGPAVSMAAFTATVAVIVGSDVAVKGAEPRLMEFMLETGFPGLLVLGLGFSVRGRRQRLLAAEARAAAAERTRDEEARRQVEAERLRIARELHDVLAHSISTINVQAGVASHLLDQQPDQARSALRAIREQSREALRELRATVGVLRQPGEPAAPLDPAPGLGQLDGLVASMRRAGLAVQVGVDGDPSGLPPSVDLIAYRIVQESLTNVLRHTPAATATVSLARLPDALVIRVDNDGAGGTAGGRPDSGPDGRAGGGSDEAGGGHGIAGMRERANAIGGELAAGPRPGGGFRVSARLPVGA
jgi:signal transduction histidine kinase